VKDQSITLIVVIVIVAVVVTVLFGLSLYMNMTRPPG